MARSAFETRRSPSASFAMQNAALATQFSLRLSEAPRRLRAASQKCSAVDIFRSSISGSLRQFAHRKSNSWYCRQFQGVNRRKPQAIR